jgi:hypothetical protein
MLNEDTLRARLEAEAHDVLTQWRRDQINLGNIGKEIFGIEGTKTAAKILEKLIEKAANPEIFTGALAGGVAGLRSAPVLATAGGLAIGVLVHIVSSVHKARLKAKESPFRYLTALEKAGVAFTIAEGQAP